MRLKDKVAIVTGGGQGIGLGIAKKLAQEGCSIVISEINPQTCSKAVLEITELGTPVLGVVGNISNNEDVLNLVNQAINKFQKIDILVNNAGVYPFVDFEKMTEEDWEKVMNTNLKGMFLMTKNVLSKMVSGARIVNISSIASFIGFEGLVHYCTSKSGVNGFTKALALELAKKNITVNAVAPGAIETPGSQMTEELKNNTVNLIPLKRIGSPLDIANAVLFLVSDEASYITGQVIVVDGGWTLR
jgi:3-oxoacyl-[acyl-carrier protein] reductase